MAYNIGNLDATLAAAAGEDTALLAELRAAFAESVERQVDLLRRSRCDGNWLVAAQRLKGVAASFCADDLIRIADEAIEGAPGDPVAIRKAEGFLAELSR